MTDTIDEVKKFKTVSLSTDTIERLESFAKDHDLIGESYEGIIRKIMESKTLYDGMNPEIVQERFIRKLKREEELDVLRHTIQLEEMKLEHSKRKSDIENEVKDKEFAKIAALLEKIPSSSAGLQGLDLGLVIELLCDKKMSDNVNDVISTMESKDESMCNLQCPIHLNGRCSVSFTLRPSLLTEHKLTKNNDHYCNVGACNDGAGHYFAKEDK